MIYVPRNPMFINAIQFNSWNDEYKGKFISMGLKQVPQGTNGRCDCGRPMTDHALMNNQLVCPGLYLLYEGNVITSVMRSDDFKRAYKSLGEDFVDAKAEVVKDAKKESGDTEAKS